jgi:Fic family protein
MALFRTPRSTKALAAQLRELDELRTRLGDSAGVASPWLGRLRRQVRASSVASSVSIEGYRVTEGQAVGIVSGEDSPGPGDEDRMAVACYARAMDHVGTMAEDPHFEWSHQVILDLHFDACHFQRDRSPGLYRTGPISVTAPGRRPAAYVGPDGDDVKPLMDEVVGWLREGDRDQHVVVRAAMAHLHVVSVHPFRDGNGRISRIVHSLVLANEGLLAPEFGSIEDYLGQNTSAYYEALMTVQRGSYQPQRDASPWVRFCVRAHLDQARSRLRQIAEAGARWSFLEGLVDQRGWPDRLVIALEQSLFGATDRGVYGAEAGVSTATASADLRRLADGGLVVQRGKGRTTRYVASESLRSDAADRLRTRAAAALG